MPVSAQIDIKLGVGNVGANAFNGGPFWNGEMSLSQTFADGVGLGMCDRVYMAERSIAASTNDDIDLNGVIVDALGATITAVEMVGFFIMNRRKDPAGAANVSTLTIGGGTNPVVGYLGGTTPTIPLKPGAFVCLMNQDATGIATITAATGDIFRVANGAGGTAVYTIGLLLRSA